MPFLFTLFHVNLFVAHMGESRSLAISMQSPIIHLCHTKEGKGAVSYWFLQQQLLEGMSNKTPYALDQMLERSGRALVSKEFKGFHLISSIVKPTMKYRAFYFANNRGEGIIGFPAALLLLFPVSITWLTFRLSRKRKPLLPAEPELGRWDDVVTGKPNY